MSERQIAAALFLVAAVGCADIEKGGEEWPLGENPTDEIAELGPGQADREVTAVQPYDFSQSIALLNSRWTEQMVGCVAEWTWHSFEDAGHHVATSETYDFDGTGDEMAVAWRADGRWTIDDAGTVEWTYSVGGWTMTERRSLALVSGALSGAVGWGSAAEWTWPSSGFAPQRADLTAFRSEYSRVASYVEGTSSESGFVVDLQLSASPAQLSEGAPCEMTLSATLLDGSTTELVSACAVSETADGTLRVIHAVGYSADWWAAAEERRLELDAQGHYEAFDGLQADELRVATIPVLTFDPASPDVLVRAGGYSLLGTNAP